MFNSSKIELDIRLKYIGGKKTLRILIIIKNSSYSFLGIHFDSIINNVFVQVFLLPRAGSQVCGLLPHWSTFQDQAHINNNPYTSHVIICL